MGFVRNAQGWTDVTPSVDTKIAYVDPTGGDDTAAVFYLSTDSAVGSDPFNPVGPIDAYKTIATAKSQLRDGYPDWLLFKKGEVITGTLWQWIISGRSALERMVIGAYGTGARPKFKTGVYPLMFTQAGGGSPENINYLAVLGLHGKAHTRDPDDPGFVGTTGDTGFYNHRTADSLLIEDCLIEWYKVGMSLQHSTGPSTNTEVRRCIIRNCYSAPGFSQGMYVVYQADLLLEENVFYHNGWVDDRDTGGRIAGGGADVFSRNVYVDNENPNDVNTDDKRGVFNILQNISLESSAEAMQIRCGGTLDNNLSVRCATGIMHAGGDGYAISSPDGVDYSSTNEVTAYSVDINSTNARGGGVNIQVNTRTGSYKNGLVMVAQSSLVNELGYGVTGPNSGGTLLFDGNVAYDWALSSVTNPPPSGVTATANVFWAKSGESGGTPAWGTNVQGDTGGHTYPDTTRTPETYVDTVESLAPGTSTLQDFYDKCMSNSRDSWDSNYTATTINDWFRAGYGLGTLPVAPSNLSVTAS